MLLALALTAQVVAAAPAVPPPPAAPQVRFSARLLAQAEAPPMPPPAVRSAVDLQQRIDDLQQQIRQTNTNWPVGAIVLAYLGFSAASLLLAGIPLTLLGVVAGSSQAGALLLAIGLGVLAAGVLGLIAGIAGVIIGTNAAAEARTTRDELVREREELQRQLDAVRARPPSVERDLTPQSLVPLAVF